MKLELPFYLQQYVAEQDYSQYTPIDQACWRYILRVSQDFFKDHGHPDYLDGLEKTGITTDEIPRISDIDQKLQKLGWRAVVVTGFIPSEAFLELLSLGVLPIACDMRKLEHLDYTPAPDIVHEAAGHAPMLVNAEYASYLRKFGEVARKVIFGKEETDVYKAVLELSEVKEDPYSTNEQVEAAQKQLDLTLQQVSYVSEAQQLSRFSWWSTEYGLFKKEDRFLIFGAGLLSSVGESYNCLSEQVQKLPFDLSCIERSFDITKPQPQLYYVTEFKKMPEVIAELSTRMSYKIGGKYGLKKALEAKTVTSVEMNSGLQIGGVLEDMILGAHDELIFLKWRGPVQLSYQDQQIPGHGPSYHCQGFSSAFGKIKNISHWPHFMNANDYELLGLYPGRNAVLNFESGFVVEGKFKSLYRTDCMTLIISLTQAKATYQGQVYFDPSWGDFDLALGTQVVSVYGGAPDRGSYLKEVPEEIRAPRKQKNNLTEKNKKLNDLYGRVRKLRNSGRWDDSSSRELLEIKSELDQSFLSDWLLRLETLELVIQRASQNTEIKSLISSLLKDLEKLGETSQKMKTLIQRGLKLLAPVRF